MNSQKHLFYLFSLIIFSPLGVFGQISSPSEYLTNIGKEYSKIAEDMMSYTSAVAHGKSARKIDKRRTELMYQIRESERSIRIMKPFEGDRALRDSIASYFRICGIVLSEDYAKILNMEDIAEQSYDAMEAYLLAKEKANEKVDQAHSSSQKEYVRFANANNIKLLDNDSKLSQKIQATKKVIKYHDTIYLLFFKSFKNEAYLLDAFSRNDISALEQSKNNLLSSAAEDLQLLGPMQSFNGDNSLKTACQQLLNFYKDEAATKAPIFVDFFLQKEKFEKMSASFNAKRQQDRTKSDVDLYNKSVEAFNTSLNKVNAVNEELNNKRGSLLANWNKISNNFLDRHTPKHN